MPPSAPRPDADPELAQVRQLLMGRDYEELLELKAKVADDEAFATLIASVITEALQTRSTQDESITETLAPTIDRAITGSINQDPRKLAESLYPIMGPAIRKSITETLQSFLENFNRLLEQSLSPQSLRWRIDAWLTGRSYSEIVLLNTLEYQVEQVFLIHRETSLLISHVTSDLAETKDPDIVSGMFSAIQDFIADSFSVGAEDALDTLRIGELNVVVQRGPNAVLAAVVRGLVPEHLRDRMSKVLEDLHRGFRDELQDYGGDPDAFATEEATLQALLESRAKEAKQRKPWLALTVLATGLTAIVWFGYQEQQEIAAREAMAARLDAEPGVVLLKAETIDGRFVYTVLADPLARRLNEVVGAVDPKLPEPDYRVYGHLSTDDEIVLRRTSARLQPEPETRMTIEDGHLGLTGRATVQWYAKFEQLYPSIPGVRSAASASLELHDPLLERATNIRQIVETVSFAFPRGESALNETDHADTLTVLAGQIVALNEAAELAFGARPDIDLVGFTDATGADGTNRRLGLARASALRDALAELGIDAAQLRTHSAIDYATREGPYGARAARVYIKLDEPAGSTGP